MIHELAPLTSAPRFVMWCDLRLHLGRPYYRREVLGDRAARRPQPVGCEPSLGSSLGFALITFCPGQMRMTRRRPQDWNW